MARAIPHAKGPVIRSLKKKCEMRAQNTGMVVTRTTELATDVYLSEAIQVTKWRHRKTPEAARRGQFSLLIRRYLLSWKAYGVRIKEANARRYVAIIKDGALQSLMKIAAVETQKIPITRPTRILVLETSTGPFPTLNRPKQSPPLREGYHNHLFINILIRP